MQNTVGIVLVKLSVYISLKNYSYRVETTKKN